MTVDHIFTNILISTASLHNFAQWKKADFTTPIRPTFPVQPILRLGDCRLREFRGSAAVLRLSAALIGPRASKFVIGARGRWQRRRTKIYQSTFLWIWSEEPRRWGEEVWRKLHSTWKTLIRVRSSTLATPTWYVLADITVCLVACHSQLGAKTHKNMDVTWNNTPLGCALTFASEAKFKIEAKISFCLEAKKKADFTWFTSMRNTKNLKRKRR